MKKIEYFEVMESFGMTPVTVDDMFDVDGGGTNCGKFECGTYSDSSNQGHGSGSGNGNGNGNGNSGCGK